MHMNLYYNSQTIIEMIPVSFADLGKAAKDLFEKNFSLGLIKIEHKGKTVGGLDVTVSGDKHLDSGRVTGRLETKYKHSAHGLTLTEKWSTDSVFTADISMEDRLVKGLKKSVELTFEPASGKKGLKVKTNYKQNYVNLNLDFDFPTPKPIINVAAVLKCYNQPGVLLGAQLTYDLFKESLGKIQYSASVDYNDLVISGSVINHSEFHASIYRRVSKQLETACRLTYHHGNHTSKFDVVGKYALDNDHFIKAKIDTNSMVHLAYGFLLNEGFKATLSGQLDGKNLDAGNHRVGLAFEFEP